MKTIDGFRLRQVMGQATIIGEGLGQINFNKLITLNATAAFLWQSVEGKEFSIADLTHLLTRRYAIDPAVAQADAAAIAGEWINNGIVQA